MPVAVREISQTDFAEWDKYVRAHSEGTFCHLSGWKTVVEKGAGQEAPFLVAEEGGKIVGALPLTLRKSLLFGKALSSSMFAVYGGAVASTSEAYEALEAAAWKLAEENKLGVLEFKSVAARHKAEAGWQVDDSTAATFIKSIGGTAEEILLDIPRKQRAVVRKSLKNDLICDWDRDLDTFYKLYSISVRNLGTPVFPKALFRSFLDVFGDDVEIQIIRSPEGLPIASLMSFYYQDSVLPYYAGGDVEARRYGAHDFMYYQLTLKAVQKGKSLFDFGRSKVGTGPYKFKKNWGFEPTVLEYEYRLAEGETIPNLSPTNKKFSLFINAWKKLPLGIANTVGPVVARHLG